jgi:hypothetical protein
MEDRLQPLVRRFRAHSTVPFLFSPGDRQCRFTSRAAPSADRLPTLAMKEYGGTAGAPPV